MGDPTKKDQDTPGSSGPSENPEEDVEIGEDDLQEVLDLDGNVVEDGKTFFFIMMYFS